MFKDFSFFLDFEKLAHYAKYMLIFPITTSFWIPFEVLAQCGGRRWRSLSINLIFIWKKARLEVWCLLGRRRRATLPPSPSRAASSSRCMPPALPPAAAFCMRYQFKNRPLKSAKKEGRVVFSLQRQRKRNPFAYVSFSHLVLKIWWNITPHYYFTISKDKSM